MGDKNLEKIVEARASEKFKGLEDFTSRTKLNKRAIEFMGYAGCFGPEKMAGLKFEREALGYCVDRRLIDEVWYNKYTNVDSKKRKKEFFRDS